MASKGKQHKLEEDLSKLHDFINAIRRPPPLEQGDGQYDKPLTSSEVGTGLIEDIKALGLSESVDDIVFFVKLLALGNTPWDDSKLQLEKLVEIMTKLPPNSNVGMQLEKLFISRLWSDLSKPPPMIANDYYRAADGSNYSHLYPSIGKSNSRYAKSVHIKHPLPLNLPDPGEIFDTLLVRKKFKPHPSSISSLLFYLATIITHDLFYSDPTDPYTNQTSSYLDLTPLYGRNVDQQMSVRQGRLGLLKPDTFADLRILLQPPAVGCLLVLFSRNHNFIAKRLLQINERGRFSVTDQNLKGQDEDLFQTARLINCRCYLQVILHDYLQAILGLDRGDNLSWIIDPTKTFPKDTMSNPIPTGVGNLVSLEFNYIYRWHPVIAEDDLLWIENVFKEILGDDYPKPGQELPPEKFLERKKAWAKRMPTDPEKRNFGLKRIAEGNLKGTFRDTDITRELVHGINQVAGSFGANGVPSILRTIEILGINSARKLGICSLNEMRLFLNLKPYESFEEMNPDKDVADTLRKHYGHIDNVEFYPGVLIEKTKPAMLGSGIATNSTISRAILSDAVNLVRNDRFYTDDCNPHNLTAWGYADSQSDPSVANGGFLYKIILRNTEGCFKPNSIYAMFPFHTPSKTKENLERVGKLDQFDFSTPAILEDQQTVIHRVLSYRACHEVFSNKDLYNVTYDADMKLITGGVGYFLGFDNTAAHDTHRSYMEKAFYSKDHNKFIPDFKQFFIKTTERLIDEKKATFNGQTYRIDVVRDICNLAPVHFISEYFGIPLKTREKPHGLYTEQETYMQFTIIFMFLFVNMDPTQGYKLARTAVDVSKRLHDVMENIIKCNNASFIAEVVQSLLGNEFRPSDQARRMMHSLMEQYKDNADLAAWSIIGTTSAIVAPVGQAASQIVEFYLRPKNKSHLEEIRRLADKNDKESEDLILGYVLEAMRFCPVIPGLYRRATASSSVDDQPNGEAKFKKDDLIVVSLDTAHMDPSAFTDPTKIDPRRPRNKYLLFGTGFHECFGKSVNFVAIPAIVKTILKLKNLRCVPGRSGQINKIEENGRSVFVNSSGTLFPFPTDMLLEFTR